MGVVVECCTGVVVEWRRSTVTGVVVGLLYGGSEGLLYVCCCRVARVYCSVVMVLLLSWVYCCRRSTVVVYCCRGSTVVVGLLLSWVYCCLGSTVVLGLLLSWVYCCKVGRVYCTGVVVEWGGSTVRVFS